MPNPMLLIDSHCHLEPDDFLRPPSTEPAEPAHDDRPAVLLRARQAGVSKLIVIGSGRGRAEIENALAFARQHAHIVAAIGVHPHDAKNIEGDEAPTELRETSQLAPDAAALWHDLSRWALEPRVIAVGETGLDYHYNHSTPAAQRALFRRFVRLSNEVKKPLSLHIRDAHAEALAIVHGDGDAALAARQGGVVHCFTGNREEARRWLDCGFHISLSGIVTFKNADELRAVAAFVPSDRLLLETDSPYLSPVPLRGRRNEPANLLLTARLVAGLRGLSVEQLAAETSSACEQLFRPASGEVWTAA
jgi:TatD DNase family protein